VRSLTAPLRPAAVGRIVRGTARLFSATVTALLVHLPEGQYSVVGQTEDRAGLRPVDRRAQTLLSLTGMNVEERRAGRRPLGCHLAQGAVL